MANRLTWILLAAAGIAPGMARAMDSALQCRDTQSGFRYLVVLNGKIHRATQATLVGQDEVGGNFAPVLGCTRIESVAGSALKLRFENTIEIDWSRIDPAQRCYVTHGTLYEMELDLRQGQEGRGRLVLRPNVKIHPRKPDCRVPATDAVVTATVSCTAADLTK